jgi:outer membrane receptor protein involved in Fe transport
VLEPLEDLERDQIQETADLRFASRDDIVGGLWLETQIAATADITLTPGLRFDLYDTGESVAFAPEPRLAARFDVTPELSLIHAVGVAHQPPSFAIPLPGLSGASDDGLQRAVQTSAGVEAKLPARMTGSATVFQNVIFDSTDIFGTANLNGGGPDSSTFTDRTTNHSYGLELYLKRSLSEELGGFVSYTLSRSDRSVARLHGPSSFDRRHVINLALAYDLGRRWRLGGRVVTYSGIPASTAYAAAAANPPRTPWFYRLDWRLEKRWLIGSSGAWWALVLEVLNTTLHEEVVNSSCYAYGCRNNEIGPVTIPSIGVEASF